MARVVVLGGTGFIGSALCTHLATVGHDVVAFSHHAAEVATQDPRITYTLGNFAIPSEIDAVVGGADYVFHLVSSTTPASNADDPRRDTKENVEPTIALLEACVRHRVKRVIFPSTGGAIYGTYPGRPLRETDNTCPVSPYAMGKLSIEEHLRVYRESQGLDSLVFRISNPYGPGQRPGRGQGLIATSIDCMLHQQPLSVFGDGTNIRDYIHVDDVARVLTQVFERDTTENVFNLGSGVETSILGIIHAVETATGATTDIHYLPARPTDVRSVVLDTSRLEYHFGVKNATITLTEDISRTVDFMRSQGGQHA